jgi:nucleoside-diphosphate-sugar epimerase
LSIPQMATSSQPNLDPGLDVRHSLADIGKARALTAYEPTHDVRSGMREAVGWYIDNLAR